MLFRSLMQPARVAGQTAAQAMLGHAIGGGLAIEGVRKPNTHHKGEKRLNDPIYVMALAATWGALLARFPSAVTVPPGGNGSGLLATYPADLVTPSERRAKGGLMRQAGTTSLISHARSAWDVAGYAAHLARLRGAA